jgi:hypothetical protein
MKNKTKTKTVTTNQWIKKNTNKVDGKEDDKNLMKAAKASILKIQLNEIAKKAPNKKTKKFKKNIDTLSKKLPAIFSDPSTECKLNADDFKEVKMEEIDFSARPIMPEVSPTYKEIKGTKSKEAKIPNNTKPNYSAEKKFLSELLYNKMYDDLQAGNFDAIENSIKAIRFIKSV